MVICIEALLIWVLGFCRDCSAFATHNVGEEGRVIRGLKALRAYKAFNVQEGSIVAL